jgi:hypothetical protein
MTIPQNEWPQQDGRAIGWVCEQCRRGNAPWVAQCSCQAVRTSTASTTMMLYPTQAGNDVARLKAEIAQLQAEVAGLRAQMAHARLSLLRA